MMKHFLLCAIVATVMPASAAVRIQMQSTDLRNNRTETQELLLDQGRFRMNSGNTSAIFLTEGGRRMLMLDKSKNQYMVIDEATMQRLASQLNSVMAQMEAALKGLPPEQRALMERMMKGKMPQAAAPPVTTEYSRAGSDTVNGFDCIRYNGTRGQDKVSEVCAAPASELNIEPSDFSVFTDVREFASELMKTLANSPIANMANFQGIAGEGYEGFPVEQTTFVAGQATQKDTIQSVERTTLTDEDFSTGDARQTELPNIPNPGR